MTDLAIPIHGGVDALGAAPHDFSTNSNACGPCPEALEAVRQADATRYPDPGYAVLREGIGAFHGVPPTRILLAASASEFIHRITALAAQHGGARGVAVPGLGYGDYAQAAQARGLAVRHTPYAQADLHWACEPSSPLGLADAAMAVWHTAPPAGLCVIDCAYRPLQLTGQRWDGTPPGLPAHGWQLWTPNKALGLTGVRAAYAIAPPGSAQHAQALNALAPSWPVGAHGAAMLQAWTQPSVQQWLVQSLHTLHVWKERQRKVCAEMGWQVHEGSLASYFCAQPLANAALAPALQRLRGAGIKLRDCASFGLPGTVRLAVLPPASQDALAAAWQALSLEPEIP